MTTPATEPAGTAPASTGHPDPGAKSGLTPLSLFLVLLVAYVLIKIKLVLVLTLLSLLFGTILERPVQLLERRRVPRPLSILAVYAVFIAALALMVLLFAPVISREAKDFRQQAPAQLRSLQASWQHSHSGLLNGPGQQLLGKAVDAMQSPPIPHSAAVTVATGVGGGIVSAVALLVITFYYLMEKPFLRRVILHEVPPRSRPRVNRVWDDVEAKVGDWMRGQLLLCLIIGLGATIGYGILGVRFWPLLGLLAGVTEILPIVGPWIGGVPAVIIALTQSWHKALVVALFLLLLQSAENTILVPRVMRGAVGLSPLTVFIAILAGAEFMGPAGALLAIPVAAAVQVVIGDALSARRATNRAAATTLPSWHWMRSHLHPMPPSDAAPGDETSPDHDPPRDETAPASGGPRHRFGNRLVHAVAIRGERPERSEPDPAGTEAHADRG